MLQRLLLLLIVALAVQPAMASRFVAKGATDQSVYVRIVSATDGTPVTDVTAATAGLDLAYIRTRSAAVSLTESDLASATATHSDGGIYHVGFGWYRVDLPDAAFASGADAVEVTGTATDMIVMGATIQLTPGDWSTLTEQQVADAMQLAPAGGDHANGSVMDLVEQSHDFLADATYGLEKIKDGIDLLPTSAEVLTDAEIAQAAADGMKLAPEAGAAATGSVLDVLSGVSTHSASDVWSSGTRTITGGTITTYTGNTPQTGDAYARIGANGAGLSAVPWNVAWDAEVQSEVADALGVYDPPTKAEMDSAFSATLQKDVAYPIEFIPQGESAVQPGTLEFKSPE